MKAVPVPRPPGRLVRTGQCSAVGNQRAESRPPSTPDLLGAAYHVRVLILLPPSEGKTAPTSGPSLDLDSLLDADRLTAARREVMSALVEVSRSDEGASVLGLGPRSAEQVSTNLTLETSPCVPAHQLFTGVLYEAARLDGASEFAMFRLITLPLLRPVLVFVLVTSVIGSFQVFDVIAVTTQGGPAGSTRAILWYIYEHAFQLGGMGYASAMSMVLFVALIAVTLAQLRFLRADQSDLA